VCEKGALPPQRRGSVWQVTPRQHGAGILTMAIVHAGWPLTIQIVAKRSRGARRVDDCFSP
jgi:hypothetical protein